MSSTYLTLSHFYYEIGQGLREEEQGDVVKWASVSYLYFIAAIYRLNTVHFQHVIYIFHTAYFTLKKQN